MAKQAQAYSTASGTLGDLPTRFRTRLVAEWLRLDEHEAEDFAGPLHITER